MWNVLLVVKDSGHVLGNSHLLCNTRDKRKEGGMDGWMDGWKDGWRISTDPSFGRLRFLDTIWINQSPAHHDGWMDGHFDG